METEEQLNLMYRHYNGAHFHCPALRALFTRGYTSRQEFYPHIVLELENNGDDEDENDGDDVRRLKKPSRSLKKAKLQTSGTLS